MTKNRILVINVNWIGDVLFSTPFIRALREAYPDSYIACLLHPRCSEMLKLNPCLNDIIIYDEEGAHKSVLGKLKLVAALRKAKFDTAFLLHRSFTKALLAKLSGIKELIGYPTKNRSFLLTTVIEEPCEELHKVEYFLNILRGCNIKPKSSSYEFFISENDKSYAEKLLQDNGIAKDDKFAVLCPGGNWPPKRWPKQSFAKLGDMLNRKLGLKIVISGSGREAQLTSEIKEMMESVSIVICGKTNLKQMGAVFTNSTLVVANDTGTMHLAVAMKANVIALFGPTSPEITGPYGNGNYRIISRKAGCVIPCYDFTCSDYKCMSQISAEDVMAEAQKILL